MKDEKKIKSDATAFNLKFFSVYFPMLYLSKSLPNYELSLLKRNTIFIFFLLKQVSLIHVRSPQK